MFNFCPPDINTGFTHANIVPQHIERYNACYPPYLINSYGTLSANRIIIPISNFGRISSGHKAETNETTEIIKRDIGEMTESLLGSAGVERLKKFMEYDAGWNFGGGFPLSRESLSKMEYFINQFFNFQVTPSVFMSNEGNLLLGWEDKTGKGIELEFFNDKIGYLIESIDEEDEITLDRKQIEILVNKLHQV